MAMRALQGPLSSFHLCGGRRVARGILPQHAVNTSSTVFGAPYKSETKMAVQFLPPMWGTSRGPWNPDPTQLNGKWHSLPKPLGIVWCLPHVAGGRFALTVTITVTPEL
eukprot:GHVO01010916.1.p1 GENE.GHVO01010916.1~~GHVO01010916.1.p1  ORF type:complete len:109 (+),score=2.14 GHVO01010916.1:543-869(+)